MGHLLLLTGYQTERLIFRKLTSEDFNSYLEFFHDPRSNRYWKSDNTDPHELCKEWFDKQLWRYQNGKGGMNLLIHRETSDVVGWCGLLVQVVDDVEELEIGYSILPRHWKKSYATEAAITCRDYAFQKNLSPPLISIIHEQNVESEKVALKNKMKLEKRTSYHNNPVKIFRITKSDWLVE